MVYFQSQNPELINMEFCSTTVLSRFAKDKENVPHRFLKPMRIGCQSVKEGTLEALYLGDFQKFESAKTDEERENAIKLMSISEQLISLKRNTIHQTHGRNPI